MSGDAPRPSEEIRALAEAVVDVLEERGLVAAREPQLGSVLKVADVASLLGRSEAWVYAHAAELGAFKYASGPKARIGFDREAIERWKRDRQMSRPASEQRATLRRGRPRKPRASTAVTLIPYEPSPRGA